MRFQTQFWLFCLLCLFLGSNVQAQSLLEEEPAVEPIQLTDEEVQNYIDQLDSNKFLLREQATEKLMSTDIKILDQVAAAAKEGTLEKGIRCLHILKHFALKEDIQAEIKSIELLEQLSQQTELRISTYAADILDRMKPIQQDVAIRILRSLGVQFTSFQNNPVVINSFSGPGIKIDDSYRGTQEQLHYLQHLHFIYDVQISGKNVSGNMLSQIAKMTNVRLMTIKDAPVDAKKFKLLEPILSKLVAIRLYYLPIDDSALPTLKELTAMQKGEFFGLNLSEETRTKITEAFPPSVILDFRMGGFLGVQSSNINDCIISDVHQGGAADKAGMLGQDRIIRADETMIESFTELTTLLAKKKPGEKVNITVMRGEVEKTLSVTLGKWPMLKSYSQ